MTKIILNKKERKLLLDCLSYYLESLCMTKQAEKPYIVLGDRLYYKGYENESE